MNNKIFLMITALIQTVANCQDITNIAKIGINSTVSIVTLDKSSQPLAYGSGFIIGSELVVTNVHVIEGGSSAYVLKDGEQKKYGVSGYVAIDKANDLVILKVDGLVGDSLIFASDEIPNIGSKIFAIGNPKGLNGTFSEGIVSGIRDLGTTKILQITAPISPGSSGGPVLNSNAEVVGIAFASLSDGQNLNFAVPIKYLITLNSQIVTTQSLSHIQQKTITSSKGAITPNINEGLLIRNIAIINSGVSGFPFYEVTFSIKNNLQYIVTDIAILILILDNTGTIVDYIEAVYFKTSQYKSLEKDNGIRPILARTFSESINDGYKPGYKVKIRILDFKVNEE